MKFNKKTIGSIVILLFSSLIIIVYFVSSNEKKNCMSKATKNMEEQWDRYCKDSLDESCTAKTLRDYVDERTECLI